MATLTTFPVDTKPLASEPVAFPKRDATLFGVKQVNGAVEQYALSEVTNTYDLRQFGVRGDTPTIDYSAEIAACFAAAPVGSVIDFPQGGTVLQRSYVSPASDHLTIRGNGCKIISDATGQDRKFNVVGRTGIKFDGLRFDGRGLTTLAVGTDYVTYTPQSNPGTIHFSDSSQCSVISCRFDGVNFPTTAIGACFDIDVSFSVFKNYYAAFYSYFSGTLSSEGTASPKRVTITQNKFLPGLHPATDEPEPPYGWVRNYPPADIWCSGAVKFRGSLGVQQEQNFAGHIISHNTIRSPGQMGIEIQGVADCSIVTNTIINSMIGISTSWTQRAIVSSNNIRNCIYAGIEVDGRTDWLDDPTYTTNDSTTLLGNNIDGRDDNGRPVNFIYSFGIVLSHVARNVTVTGGAVKYCKTGIAINQASNRITLTGVRIQTNEESGTGGSGGWHEGTMEYVQGVYIANSHFVDIVGCNFESTKTAWQRMIYIIDSTDINIKSCTAKSNNTCIYALSASDVTIEDNRLEMGPNPGGTNKGFVTVESTYALCDNITIRRNTMVGSVAAGIRFVSPANKVDNVLIEGNDTRRAVASDPRFLFVDTTASGSYTGGTRGRITSKGNTGPAVPTLQNALNFPFWMHDGNSGAFNDSSEFEEIDVLNWGDIYLQPAANYFGVKKRFTCLSKYATVAIKPKSGETINGSANDLILKTQFSSVRLRSDGVSNWIATQTAESGNLSRISSKSFSNDFGTAAAGEQVYVNVSVPCESGATNMPSVAVGWAANLPGGIMFKQAFVSSWDQVTIVLMNVTGNAINVGTQTGRVTVFEPKDTA